jgi:nucleoside-diphosphate-sugar epimerase
MNVLITSAATDLAQALATTLSSEHQIRLTDLIDVQTEFEFVKSDLGHEEATNQLVQGMDAVIHLAQLPPALLDRSTDPENVEIGFLTRCTYNLLWAAAEEKVPHAIFASTLRLMDAYDENWTVSEKWRPRPGTDTPVLSRHLGEFTCREFAREGRIGVTCLRLGTLATAADAANPPFDSTCLEMQDAVHAFDCALKAGPGRWAIFHIQSEFPNSRFSIHKAKEFLKFNPQFTVEE